MERLKKNVKKKNEEKFSDIIDGGRISFFKLCGWSWNLAWKKCYALKYLLLFLIIFAICIPAIVLDFSISDALGAGDDVFMFFTNIVEVILSVGLMGFTLNVAKGIAQKIGDFFHEITWSRIRKSFLCSLLVGLIFLGGFLLFVIPGLFFIVRLSFALNAVIHKGLGPVDAIEYSWKITKGHFWEIVLFNLFFVLVNILGMLCLFIGLIWTESMSMMAQFKYYLYLSDLHDNNLGKNG